MIDHIKITPYEHLKVLRVIYDLSRSHGVSMLQAYYIIQRAIQRSWDAAWIPGNIRAQMDWQQLFPGDRCPTVAEFITTLGREMMAGNNPPYLLD